MIYNNDDNIFDILNIILFDAIGNMLPPTDEDISL